MGVLANSAASTPSQAFSAWASRSSLGRRLVALFASVVAKSFIYASACGTADPSILPATVGTVGPSTACSVFCEADLLDVSTPLDWGPEVTRCLRRLPYLRDRGRKATRCLYPLPYLRDRGRKVAQGQYSLPCSGACRQRLDLIYTHVPVSKDGRCAHPAPWNP